MGIVNDIKNIISGKGDQVKGDIQDESGHGIKGGLSKTKGKIKEEIGKTNLNNRKNDWDDKDFTDEDI